MIQGVNKKALTVAFNFYTSEWFDKRMKINQERLKTFKSTCEKYKDKLKFERLEESSHHYKFMPKLKVMGCLVRKVGSTSLQKTIKEVNQVESSAKLNQPTLQLILGKQ